MKRKLWSVMLSISLTTSLCAGLMPVVNGTDAAAASQTRQMEYLDRGLVAVRVNGGVYLSWRLLGTEETDTKFDIYRNGEKIVTALDNTNYTDDEGFDSYVYQVVPSGNDVSFEKQVSVLATNYMDVPLNKPTPDPVSNDKAGTDYTYSVNDTSVGDVDGDGEYELIVKWDPSNSKDNSQHGYTGNVYLDAYKLDGTQLWRIDMGKNIRAGAHYTQFIVYDFDGDGKAELACRTAPDSKDGSGNYVTDAAGEKLEDFDNGKDYRQGGSKKGHIISGPDFLTMFNGETGEAMSTINYVPQRGSVKSWGDSYGGRSERYLAGVAYLNGTTPSLIMCRGYYEKAAMAAFDWDGTKFIKRWDRVDTSKSSSSIYGQGTHSLSVADLDNDGYDEIIFGSAAVDQDGSILHTTGHGHGDALHVSDFNDDGNQEIFMVHEEKAYYKNYGAELRDGKTGSILASVGSSGDTGRGVMGNIIANSPGSEFWSSANNNLYNQEGKVIGSAPGETNFLIWWDGDLTREVLDKNRIVKYTNDGTTTSSQRLETFSGIHANNSSKATPALSADIFGDWREEVMFGTDDNNKMRIFMSVTPTEHKLTTLMHDSQYRCAIAWQNVAYNQPPHPSYYIGDDKTNYPKPNIAFAHTPDITEPTPTPTPIMELTDIFPVQSFNDISDSWGFTSGKVITDSNPYKYALSLSGTATKTLDIPSDVTTFQFDFSWKPTAANAEIRILDENKNNIFTLKKPSGAMTYQAGKSGYQTFDTSLTKTSAWYNVSMTIDTVSKLVNCTVVDYSSLGTEKKYVYCASFADNGGTTISALQTYNTCLLDNVRLSSVTYNVPMKVITFDVEKQGSPCNEAKITIDGKTLFTNAEGKAVIMLQSGKVYDYTITKTAHKTYRDSMVVADTDITNAISLQDGENCNIYIQYKNQAGLDIQDQQLAGTAIENTSYTVSDILKRDITYTSEEVATEGETNVYEYDPDATDATVVNVEGTTYIPLIYKEKIVPGPNDIDVLRVNLSENGIGRGNWNTTAGGFDYTSDNNGVKYAMFNNLGGNAVTINLPKKVSNYVIEFDIMLTDMTYGGNIFGLYPYSGSQKGNGIGFRSSKPEDARWQLVTATGNNAVYVPYVSSDNALKGENNWKNQWAHFIITGNGSSMSVTLVNKTTGQIYVDNQAISLVNNVGSASAGIDKLVFTRINGTGDWSMGLREVKVYTIGGATNAVWRYDEATVMVPSETNLSPSVFTHETDVEGVSFDVSGNLSYELQSTDGTAVNRTYISIDNTTGILSVKEGVEKKNYSVTVKYNGTAIKTIPVKFASVGMEGLYGSSFVSTASIDCASMNASDNIEGWTPKKGSNTVLSAAGGTLNFAVGKAPSGNTTSYTPANGGREFYKDFDVATTDKASIAFKFKTGGVKINGSDWSWASNAFTFKVQMLGEGYDAATSNDTDNLMMQLSQSFTSKAQSTEYASKSISSTAISGKWTEVGNIGSDPSGNVLNRSVTTWNITADFDYKNDVGTIYMLTDSGNGYKLENFPLNGQKFKTLRFVCTKDSGSSGVVWMPNLSNVTYSQYIYAPDAPTAVAAELTDDNTVSVSWTDGENGGSPITGYYVVAYKDDVEYKKIPAVNAPALISLNEAGEYTFAVIAENKVGESMASIKSESVEIENGASSEEITINTFAVTGNSAAANITNNTDKEQPIILVGAVYDENGICTKIQTDEKILQPDNTADFTVNDLSGGTVKAFIWNSLSDMMPLTASK